MRSHKAKGAVSVGFTPKERYDAQDLVRIVAQLRAPQGGCPWDREQTHTSIRMNFIEETYEAVDAIDQNDAHLLCEELGDVMLQVALHSQMEAEKGTFTFDDVCDGICKKLIYRHPHVFGEESAAATTGQALANWEALKNAEKGRATAKDRLESVPRSFPALMRAAKLQKRAGAYGFAYQEPEDALNDVKDELAELEQAMQSQGNAAEEVGDLLFAAAGLARALGVDPEQVLTGASDRYQSRIIRCEELAGSEALAGLSDEERRALWRQAKNEEQSSKV